MKKSYTLKTLFKASDIITYLLLISAGTLGFIQGDFLGGTATGGAIVAIFFSAVGKILFIKSIKRIDKIAKDNIESNRAFQ